MLPGKKKRHDTGDDCIDDDEWSDDVLSDEDEPSLLDHLVDGIKSGVKEWWSQDEEE